MLYRDDVKIQSRQMSSRVPVQVEKPEHCQEFKACLMQALKIIEERYEV